MTEEGRFHCDQEDLQLLGVEGDEKGVRVVGPHPGTRRALICFTKRSTGVKEMRRLFYHRSVSGSVECQLESRQLTESGTSSVARPFHKPPKSAPVADHLTPKTLAMELMQVWELRTSVSYL